MKECSEKIHDILSQYKAACAQLDDGTASIKLGSDKWTVKEIVGHLIDSASNNHQRIVRLQLEKTLRFPDYSTDPWLNVQQHTRMDFRKLYTLFEYYNILLSEIIENIDPESHENRWMIRWGEEKDFITLEELVRHYTEHLQFHLDHLKSRIQEIQAGMNPVQR